MSSLGNRVSRLEARATPNIRMPVTVFEPLTMDNIEDRIADAERDAAATGHQLLAIRIVDSWRTRGRSHEKS
jgi:hypothetical protein